MSEKTGFIKFRRVDSISGTPDPRTLYLINKYSGTGEDTIITYIDLQFGGFSVGRMDYSTIFDSDNDIILDFVYNDTSKQLEVKANLNRKNAEDNLLKIDGTGWYVDTKDVESIIDSYIGTKVGLTVETWNTTAKTLALSDANKLFICSHAGNQTVTIPSNATAAFPIGTMITFLLTSPYKVTFVGASGVTLTSIDSLVTLATQFAMASLIKTDTNTWQLVGALE